MRIIKIFSLILFGILLQKAAVSAQWYSYYNGFKKCKAIKYPLQEVCIQNEQGIFYYIGIVSGTITPKFGGGHVWRY